MKKKNLLSLALVLVMMVTLTLPVGSPVFAANSTSPAAIDVSDSSGTNLPAGVTYASNLFTIGTGANNSTIDVTGTTITNTIAVATGVSNLTLILNGVSITSPSGGNSPIDLQGTASVTIELADGTSNTINASAAVNRAGIHTASGAVLTISGTTGSLTATGGQYGAAIGGGRNGAGGTIAISGGVVNAIGGEYGAGIGGGGLGGAGGTIAISGGTITATGCNGAGIGGGYSGGGGTTTISGGTVIAGGNGGAGTGGAGIGGGGNAGAGGSITINGSADVTATAGDYAAGIGGGGNQGAGGTIVIGGNAIVKATGNNGAGIGSGFGTATSAAITISGTPVIMAAGSGKPAIDAAAGSTGNVINAKFQYTASSVEYLKCNGHVLTLPKICQYFAFSAAAASSVGVYSDPACTAASFLGSVVTDPAGSADIPLTSLPAITNVKLLTGSVINIGDSNVRPASVSFSGGVFTVNSNAVSPITVIGTTTTNTIAVAGGVTGLTLILNDVSITSPIGGNSPIDLQGTAGVTIKLAGGTNNILDATSANNRAGLGVTSSAAVTIDGTGSVTATGGSYSAGIGGGSSGTGGTITINGGTVTATGGINGAAGIGGGSHGQGGTITINGGTVTATGVQVGAGIGGGSGSTGGSITISGGLVTATGQGAAGIGGASSCEGGTINISGGTVNARCSSGNAAGIGGGGSGAGGMINISGGFITATGDWTGAGIGGGGNSAGGDISISGSATVIATGGASGGAGIGGGLGGSGGTITIGSSAVILAASNGSGNPAIHASSGSIGNVINAKLNNAISASSMTYLKCNSNVLPFPANYKFLAFSAAAASAIGAYSDSGCNTLMGSIVQVSDDSPSISITDLGTSPADVTPVKLQTVYSATITVNRDGSAWTTGTPDMQLSTASTSITGAVSGTCTNGVYTFTGLNSATTYYVWDATNNNYVNQSVTSTSTTAAVNYYTVQFSTAYQPTASGSTISAAYDSSPISSGAVVLGGKQLDITAVGQGASNYIYAWSGAGTSGQLTQTLTISNLGTAVNAVCTVKSNAPKITTAALPNGKVGISYSQSISAVITGGLPTFGITGGSLPAGLNLNTSSGTISGVPTTVGTANFDVNVTNSNGSDTKSLSITIDPGDPTIDNSDFSVLDAVAYTGSGLSPTAGDIAAKYTGTAGLRASDISNIKVGGAATQINNGTYNIAFDVAAYSGHYSACSVTITNGFVINKVQLTITGASATNKVYDGNNIVAVTGGTLAGVVAADTANVVLDGTPTGTVVDANAGNTKAVTVTGYTITGTAASNYILTQPTGVKVNINPATPAVMLTNKTTGYTGSPIPIAAADVAGINSETPSGTVTYVYYTDSSCTTQTTTANSGAVSDGSAPVNAGTYYVKATIAANGNYSSATSSAATLTISAAPTYSIALTPSSDKTFTAASVGYGAQTAYNVTISNTGNQATGALTITLGGTNASSYTLSKTSTSSIAVSGNDSFTVVPNTGLPAGTYTATVTVAGSNSISATFNVSFTCNGGGSGGGGGGGGNSGGSTSTPTPTPTNVPVIVDGTDYYIGNIATEDSIATITVDQSEFDKQLEAAKQSVVIPVTSDASTVVAQLVVKNVQDMNDKGVPLYIQTGNISYDIPAASIDTKAILSALGQADPSLAPVNVTIKTNVDAATKAIVDTAVSAASVKEIIPAVQFEISASYNGKSYNVENFNNFVSRSVEITPEQALQITTAIVVNPDGTVRHVPTKVTTIDGKYYAVINSLTNSIYTVIRHPLEFKDVEKHWAKDAVNDMGSRMVVSGIGKEFYEPDRDITRAEFAAIIVRALGLAPGKGKSSFNDVDTSKWYCGYIETASEYGIIKGYNTNTFGPNDVITREQAMSMIAGAMKITGLKSEITADETKEIFTKYTDAKASSDYAKVSITACLKTGIVAGRSSTTISPKDYITRAEVAVIVQRLLKKSGLI